MSVYLLSLYDITMFYGSNFLFYPFLKKKHLAIILCLSPQYAFIFSKGNLPLSGVWLKLKHCECISLDYVRFFQYCPSCATFVPLHLTSSPADNFTSSWKSKHLFPLKKYIKLQKHDIQCLNKTKQANLKIFMNFKSFKFTNLYTLGCRNFSSTCNVTYCLLYVQTK